MTLSLGIWVEDQPHQGTHFLSDFRSDEGLTLETSAF